MNLRRNTLWNLAGGAVPLIAAAALVPFMLHRLGGSAFGVLTLIWSIVGYFSLFDMGIGRALTYELSKLAAKNNHYEISLMLKAGLSLTFFTGILGGLIMLMVSPYLVIDWLKIEPALQQDAILAFKITAIGVVFTTMTSGLRGALEGLNRFAESNLNKMILGAGMFALPALSMVVHGNHLWIITLYLVFIRFIMMLAALLQLRNYFISSTLGLIKSRFKVLLNYGGWMTVTGIVGPLMVYGDRFFVSATVGAHLLPFYSIPQEGLFRLFIIPSALCGALFPQFAALNMRNVAVIYQRNYKRVAVVMLGVCLLTAVLIYPVLAWWISTQFAQKALAIALILLVGVWLTSMATVPYALLHAKGHVKLTALFHVFELMLYVVVLWWLTQRWGLVGAAIAWAGRSALDLILLHLAANKLLRVSYAKN